MYLLKGEKLTMKNIIERIFPKVINNEFKGYKIALYVFYALTAVTIWRSQHHMFAPDGGAQSIATIPLDTFTDAGATTVISVFSLWGLSQLIIGIMYLVSAIRYRSMIPMWYLLMFVEYLFRATYVMMVKPIPTVGTAPGAAGNLPLMIISLTMLTLSLMTPRRSKKI